MGFTLQINLIENIKLDFQFNFQYIIYLIFSFIPLLSQVFYAAVGRFMLPLVQEMPETTAHYTLKQGETLKKKSSLLLKKKILVRMYIK